MLTLESKNGNGHITDLLTSLVSFINNIRNYFAEFLATAN